MKRQANTIGDDNHHDAIRDGFAWPNQPRRLARSAFYDASFPICAPSVTSSPKPRSRPSPAPRPGIAEGGPGPAALIGTSFSEMCLLLHLLHRGPAVHVPWRGHLQDTCSMVTARRRMLRLVQPLSSESSPVRPEFPILLLTENAVLPPVRQ